mgnify:CR=1 FL=1
MRCRLCNNKLSITESVIKNAHGEYRDTCGTCEVTISNLIQGYDDFLLGWLDDLKIVKGDES